MTMLMTAADRVDPTVRRRLGTKAALAVTAVMTAVVGGSAAGAVWIFANGVRAQAETAGRQATVTAATAFATLAEPSAANIARTPCPTQCRVIASSTGGRPDPSSTWFKARIRSGAVSTSVPSRSNR